MYVSMDVPAAASRLAAAYRSAENKEPTEFWTQLVRDIDGRWSKYTTLRSMENTRYFYGAQPHVDYEQPTQVALLHANIKVRHKIYSTLENLRHMESTSFLEWLKGLRNMMEYRPTEDWKNEIHATTTHTAIVVQDIIPLAERYGDPYARGNTKGPLFAGFPEEALPIDEALGDLIRHTYPSLEFSSWYLDAAIHQIKTLLNKRHSYESYTKKVALIYQLLINLHYFPSINTSLYMNIANSLLEIAGIQGVEHGIQDFASMRLQPANYQAYFYDSVKLNNLH